MKRIVSVNRSGKSITPSAPGGTVIPMEPEAESYPGHVVFAAASNDDPAGYAVISLQDYLNGTWAAPVYAILYTFVRTSFVNEFNTDEYRVDYVGRVAGVSDEFMDSADKPVRTYLFCGLKKTGQGVIDSWELFGENGGLFTSRNLRYADVGYLLSEDRMSYFRPANDVILSDETGMEVIAGSDYTTSKWQLKTPITDSSTRALEVMQWSGVRADGSTKLLGSYWMARFSIGQLSSGMNRLNLDRYILQIAENSSAEGGETVVNLYDFSSPVAIDPATSDLYWLCFGIGSGQASLIAYFTKTGAIPIDNTLPFVMDVCPLISCGALSQG